MSESKENRAKLGRWLPPLVFAPDEGAKAPDKVELRHLSVGDKATAVRAWGLGGADDNRVKDVLDQLHQAAADDADGVGGVQKYAAVATAEGAPVGRLVLRYRSESTDANGVEDFESEPANGKGLVSQAMRHTEAMAKALAVGAGGTIEQLVRQNARLSSMVETMLGKHMEHIALVEELQSGKHQRELEMRAQEAADRAKEQIVGELANLLPAVVQKVTGYTSPNYLAPEVLALRKLAGNLKDEQIDVIMGALEPSQAAALAAVLGQAAQGEVDAQERKNGAVG